MASRARLVAVGVVVFAAGVAAGLGGGGVTPQAIAQTFQAPERPAPTSRGMQAVLDALDSRERALERRERSIEARESELRQVESKLDERLAELKSTREAITALLSDADEAEEAQIAGVTKMVSSMRAKQAAGMVGALDDDLAAEVLGRMSGRNAGKLLAALPADVAARLTEKMAQPPLAE